MMLRTFALHDIPSSHIAAMERWYYRDHAPEIDTMSPDGRVKSR
jgi:hypothetical protein